MKNINHLEKRQFGIDEHGFTLIPTKFSNIKISRIYNCDDRGGCPFCFPHGIETNNATVHNAQRNWKKQRNNQWKS